MADQINEVVNAFETSLSSIMNTTQMTAAVVSVTNLAYPTYLCIEADDPAQREYVRVTSTVGSTLQLSERYGAGSAAPSGLTHPSGSSVQEVPAAQFFNDLSDRIDADQAAFDAHHGGTDTADHPEATPSIRGFMSPSDKATVNTVIGHAGAVGAAHGAATGALAGFMAAADKAAFDTHVGGGDQHTLYLKEEASGGLASEVPDHTHASGAQAGTVAHSDLTGLTSGDPHTQYLNVTRHDNEHSALEARRATSNQPIGDATETTVVFNSVVNESDADGDFTLDVGTGILTINNAGWYKIAAGLVWQPVAGGIRRRISIFHNGAFIGGDDMFNPPSNTLVQNASRLKKLAATDTITISAYHNETTPASLNVLNDAGTFLTVHRVRSV